MERSTIFNGKIHYFDWAIFNSYVNLPEGILQTLLDQEMTGGKLWGFSWLAQDIWFAKETVAAEYRTLSRSGRLLANS